tara:strand:+ start:815 stop:1711 length:897 start_codon:yes stop_codon:yes gene_type:complete
MIKNKIKFINLILISFFVFFLFSCSSDSTPPTDPGTPSPTITLDGEWTSGSISYHADESDGADCSGNAMTLESFANIIITSNISVEAEYGAGLTCASFTSEQLLEQNMTLDECEAYYTAENIENLTTLITTEDITSYQNKISHSYNYGDMTLTLTEGTTNSYVVAYDGECVQTEEYTEFTESACAGIEDAEWNGSECIMTSFTSCEEIAGGDWDAASTGLWHEVSDDNYILEDFLGNTDPTTLVFDGSSVYIVLDSNLNHCICGDDAIEQDYSPAVCVLSAEDCVFLERYCVSLSFSK